MIAARAAASPLSVAVYHNILWPKYKGEIFSSLYDLSRSSDIEFRFVQIAASESSRSSLAGVDLRHHRYPYQLLFSGNYDAVGKLRLISSLVVSVMRDRSAFIVLPGYHKPEYWAMLFVCMAMGKRRGVFCDSTVNDQPATSLKTWLKRFFFRQCDVFLAYGQRSAEYLLQLGAKPPAVFSGCQAAALPFGFDAEHALRRRVAIRAEKPAPVFLYVGRLAAEKGLGTLIEAFAQVRSKQQGARLVLAGDGDERTRLASAIVQAGVNKAVEFTGGLDAEALSAQYLRATCLVLPSTSEPWGLVVNEALHHGCPAIVSDVCGCTPDLIVDGVTGFSFPVGDVSALAGLMEAAVRRFAETSKVARDCQAHVSRFTPARAARRIFEGCVSALRSHATVEAA